MRLVMDVLFCETIEFRLPHGEFAACRVAPSQEEVLRAALAKVGIELIDYGSYIATPLIFPDPTVTEAWMSIAVYSNAYRERAERAAARR